MNYFDLHCDTPFECYKRALPLNSNSLAVRTDNVPFFDRWTQCFAIWIDDKTEKPYSLYKSILNDFKSKISLLPKNLFSIITVEGGAVIENNLSRVEELYQDGVRALTLTWNGENAIAGGVNSDKGLTVFGEQVISELNRFKMVCDLSHLNEKSFYSALEVARYPIVTHSCCTAVHQNKRNLTDCQLKALFEKNGIIGICFYPEFAGDDVFEGIYRNILHICELGYENNIALGSDFDGAKMHNNLSTVADIPRLYEFLEQKGIEKRLLDNIFYNNAEKIFVSL